MIAVEERLAAINASGDRTLVAKVESMADHVVCGVLEDLAQEFEDRTIPDDVKVALADHFWCDLLAQFAHAIDEGLKRFDSVPDRLADRVMRSREQSRWRRIEDWVVRAAAKSLWKRVRLVASIGLLNRPVILPVTRLLAILMCKAPERHRAVVEYCVDPLGNQFLATIKAHLVEVLSEWLPRMRESTLRPL